MDYQTIFIVLTGIGMIIALTYYSFQIRNQNKTRQAQIYLQIYNKFADPDWLERYYKSRIFKPKDFEDYVNTLTDLRENNTRAYAELVSVGATFEGMGVLIKRGFIDPQYVADTMTSLIIHYWEEKEHLFRELRERWNNPRIYEEIEYLYSVISEIDIKEHPELKT